MFKATAHTRNVAQLEMSSHIHTPHSHTHTTLTHTHTTLTHTHHTHTHHTHTHTGRKSRETRDGLAGQGYQCLPLEIMSHDQNGMWNKNLKRYMNNS